MTEPQQSASSAEALKGKRGLRRLINATGYSIKGIRAGLEHEAAFREEFLLAVILIPTALFLPVTLPEKALLVISVLLLCWLKFSIRPLRLSSTASAWKSIRSPAVPKIWGVLPSFSLC